MLRCLSVLFLLSCVQVSAGEGSFFLTDRVAAFWYGWYSTPENDGRWGHWNHSVLPHWTENVRRQYPEAAFLAPEDIHAPFYPAIGPYSSANRSLIRWQLDKMKEAGVGVAILSWWGRPEASSGDSQGVVNDDVVQGVFEVAEEMMKEDEDEKAANGIRGSVKIALHLEPYPGRDVLTFREDIRYIVNKYGHYRCWQRIDGRRVYYAYDSYHIKPEDWALLLVRGNMDPRARSLSLRGSGSGATNGAHDGLNEFQRQLQRKLDGLPLEQPKGPHRGETFKETKDENSENQDLDGFYIGLWLDSNHGDELKRGGFDGAYSYFASDGSSYGATTSHWQHMAEWAKKNGLVFIPCVGPGYDDSKIRPWNAHTKKARQGGQYYRSMWDAALGSSADRVAVTSWNEWGEGTQIEPAVPRSIDVAALAPKGLALGQELRKKLRLQDKYEDYGKAPGSENLYLRITREYSERLLQTLLGPATPPSVAPSGGQRTVEPVGKRTADVLLDNDIEGFENDEL
jgi:glycoprotein endo-alpha-1,2-mannosidase